jgi:ribosomal protein S18 acetylase RimI-like enzyme
VDVDLVQPASLRFEVVPADDPAARALQRRHHDDVDVRYGAVGMPDLKEEEYRAPSGAFVVAWMDDTPVGCGGFRVLTRPSRAELKCLHVISQSRRMGVAARLLAFLEGRASEAGYTEMWLETGTEQPEALSLYAAVGYRYVESYGSFRMDPRNRCMAKQLRGV